MFSFNLKIKKEADEMFGNELWSYNLMKNKALLTGDANAVRYFYQRVAPNMLRGNIGAFIGDDLSRSFFNYYNPDNAFVFYGLTKMINQGIVRLLTSGGYDIHHEDEELKQRVADLLEFNNFDILWNNAVSLESGLGDFGFKISLDGDFEGKPVIEVVSPENIEVIRNRGLEVSYVVKTFKTLGDRDYELHEVFEKTDNGALITYKLYDMSGDRASELSFEEAEANGVIELFGLEFLKNGNKWEGEVEVLGVSQLPFIFKKNTQTMNGRGIPDTEGLDYLESALSEVLSNMVDEVAKNGFKAVIDDKIVPKDEFGNSKKFDLRRTEIVTTKSYGDTNKLIEAIQGELRSPHYIDLTKHIIGIACNRAGIHPLTIGVTGLESIVASAESQQEREGKTSLRTRDIKLETWEKTFKQLAIVLLELEDIASGRAVGNYNMKDFVVNFGEYTNPNIESKIALKKEKIEAGLTSLRHELEKEFEGYTDEEIDKIYMEVKIEKGMPLTPEEQAKLNVPLNRVIEDEIIAR